MSSQSSTKIKSLVIPKNRKIAAPLSVFFQREKLDSRSKIKPHVHKNMPKQIYIAAFSILPHYLSYAQVQSM